MNVDTNEKCIQCDFAAMKCEVLVKKFTTHGGTPKQQLPS